MPDLNRTLSAKELEDLKAQSELDKALREVEEQHTKRAEEPSKWFGRLLAVLVVAGFLDISGWWTAFISGKFYAVFAQLLQTLETLSIVGMAGLAVFGSVEAYRLQEARKKVTAEHSQGNSSKDKG